MRSAMRAALLLTGITVAASVWAGPFSVGEIDGGARREIVYRCAGRAAPLRVAYWNARNGQGFALVPVAGRPLLFVDTVSGSGAKYEADHYVWWTKGRGANLYDVLAGEQAAPVLADCAQVDR
jgi:membrane-bound inhibitor of C-type lysozyme